MAEHLSPEAQAAFDLNRGVQEAIAERDQKALDDLHARGRELAVGYAKDRVNEAKESEADAKAKAADDAKDAKADAKAHEGQRPAPTMTTTATLEGKDNRTGSAPTAAGSAGHTGGASATGRGTLTGDRGPAYKAPTSGKAK